ncbi:LOW QUALITY PROTEIN: hypothetical protein BRADI_4g26076v3 [Brachypodium distachyon]|uniref:F-box domain-containing protein n=1 Tax=Brachypodium distachyon TaxID=15368 RepID=A0A2K2CQ84_BRADI|nr:LOW QUALITY PROTEIN: hypothetical protein BRADI_4g26076v3 [Brachypodium distachyon]
MGPTGRQRNRDVGHGGLLEGDDGLDDVVEAEEGGRRERRCRTQQGWTAPPSSPACSWRRVWCVAPLILIDMDLLPTSPETSWSGCLPIPMAIDTNASSHSQYHARPFPMDAETEAYYRDRGVDPWILELNLITALTCLHYILANPTSFQSSNGATALPYRSTAPIYRISRLPDVLLGRIVSRLPVKEGACTALLSRRWRGVWRPTLLVLADVDLLSTRSRDMLEVTPTESRAVASAVSRILAGHQGPIRCARLVSCYMKEIPGLLVRWLHLLAINVVRELFLFNRPWPLNMQLPVGFFGIATLTRLYLGIFTFPDTVALPHAIQFPHLCELGLFCMTMENRDMDFVLARTPVLKTLCIQINILLMCLCIISRSHRCVHIIGGTDLDVVMEDAPQQERLT